MARLVLDNPETQITEPVEQKTPHLVLDEPQTESNPDSVFKISAEHNLPFSTAEEYEKWASNIHAWKDKPNTDDILDNVKRTELSEHIDYHNWLDPTRTPQQSIDNLDLEILRKIGFTDAPTAEEFNKQNMDTIQKKGNIGFLEAMERRGNFDWEKLPLAKEIQQVYYALLANKEYMGTITQDEQSKLNRYRLDLQEESIRGKTLSLMIYDGLTETAKYGLEFLATDGLYTAGRTVGRKAGTALLGKFMKKYWARAGIKSAGALAGTLPRTLAMSYRAAGDTADQYTMGERDIYKEGVKNLAKLYISNLSEMSGEGLDNAAKNLARGIKKSIPVTTTMGRIIREFPEKQLIKNIRNGLYFFNKAGIQSAPEELFEEYAERFLDASVGLGNWNDIIPDKKQAIAEAATVSLFPLAGGTISGIGGFAKSMLKDEAKSIAGKQDLKSADVQNALETGFSEFTDKHPELNEDQQIEVLHAALSNGKPSFDGSENLVDELKTNLETNLQDLTDSATIPSMAEDKAARDNIESSKQQPSGKDGVKAILKNDYSTKFPKGTEVEIIGRAGFAGSEAKIRFADGSEGKFPDSWLKKAGTQQKKYNLPDLVKKYGRDKINVFLDEWERGATLTPDNKSISTITDSRNVTGKRRASTKEFLEWFAENESSLISPQPTAEAGKGNKVKAPKKLYRGITNQGQGIGTFSLGKGLYSTPSKDFLKNFKFEKIIELSPDEAYPQNPLILNAHGNVQGAFSDWLLKESGEKNIRDFNKKYPDASEFVKSKGYDGVVAGDEIVKYSTDKSSFNQPAPEDGGSKKNRIISEDAYQEARQRIKSGGLKAGVDPQNFIDLFTIGAYHFENGVRTFAEWSKKMMDEIGEKVKPLLSDTWDRVVAQQGKPSDIQKTETRRKLINQVENEILQSDIYQEAKNQYGSITLNLDPKDPYVISPKSWGEIKDAISGDSFLEKCFVKGKDGEKYFAIDEWASQNYIRKSDTQEDIESYQGQKVSGKENVADVDLFIDAIKASKEARNKTTNTRIDEKTLIDALDLAKDRGDIYFELMALKRSLLKEGKTPQDINAEIVKFADDYEINRADIENELVPDFVENTEPKPSQVLAPSTEKLIAKELQSKEKEIKNLQEKIELLREQKTLTREDQKLKDQKIYEKQIAKLKKEVETNRAKLLKKIGEVKIQKAENEKLITKDQALKMRFKQQAIGAKAGYKQALADIQEDIRLAEQKANLKGFRQGYKLAANEARENLRKMMMEKKENRQEAYDLIKSFIPKDQQDKFLKDIRDADNQKDIDDLSKKINDFIDQYEQKKTLNNFKKFIKNLYSEYNHGKIKLGKLPNEVREKIFRIIGNIDLANITPEKMVDINALKDRIGEVAGSLSQAYTNWNELVDNGEEILRLPDDRIAELDRLNKTPASQLTSDDLENIQKDIQDLIDVSERKAEIRRTIRAERLGKDITDSRSEIYDRGEEDGTLNEPGKLFRFTASQQGQIRTLAGLITNKNNTATMKVLAEKIYEGYSKRNAKYKEFIEAFNNLLVENGLTHADSKMLDKEVEITLGGKTFTTTYNYLLGLYMHTQARSGLNLRSLLDCDGLNIYTKKGSVRTGKISLSELRDAIEKLPEKLKTLGQIYFTVNNEHISPAINETSLKLENREVAVYQNYWHISRETSKELEGSTVDIAVPIEWQGRWKPIVGGTQRINIDSFSAEVMKSLQLGASYHAMTEPFQDARTMIMNKAWRNKLKESGNESILKDIITIYRNSFGMMSEQTIAEQFAAGKLAKIGRSYLAARLSGALVQLAGVPSAFEVIAPKYFVGLSVPTPGKIKQLGDENPSLWIRWKGKQFNYVLGTEAALNSFNELLFDKTALLDMTTNPYTWGDMAQIWYVYQAAKKQILAETNLKEGTPEFKEELHKLVDRAVETQGQFDTLHRSVMTSSKSLFLRTMTLFMSARNAQYNIGLRAIDDYKKGRIGKVEFSERIGSVMFSCFLEPVIRKGFQWTVKGLMLAALLNLADDDDEKKKLKDAALATLERDAKKVIIDTPLNLIGLSVFGQMGADLGQFFVKGLSGQNPFGSNSDVRTGNAIGDLFVNIGSMAQSAGYLVDQIRTGETYLSGNKEGEEKWKTTIIDFADKLGDITAAAFGLPYSGIKGDFVWPAQSILHTRERLEKDFDYRIKNMTPAQLRKERKEYIYQRRYRNPETKEIHRKGEIKKNKEERLRKIDELLARG